MLQTKSPDPKRKVGIINDSASESSLRQEGAVTPRKPERATVLTLIALQVSTTKQNKPYLRV